MSEAKNGKPGEKQLEAKKGRVALPEKESQDLKIQDAREEVAFQPVCIR